MPMPVAHPTPRPGTRQLPAAAAGAVVRVRVIAPNVTLLRRLLLRRRDAETGLREVKAWRRRGLPLVRRLRWRTAGTGGTNPLAIADAAPSPCPFTAPVRTQTLASDIEAWATLQPCFRNLSHSPRSLRRRFD